MAVAPDASSRAHADSSSQNQTSFTWNHAGAASGVKGILVLVFHYDTATDHAGTVTYDGVTVPAVTGGRATDAASEAGSVKAYFLGSGVPQGTKAVVVNRTSNGSRVSAMAFTVLADGDTEVTGIVLENDNRAFAEVNVDDGSPGTNSLRIAGLFSGHNSVASLTIGANSTALQSNDPATTVSVTARETNAGQGSRPVGYTAATEDAAGVYLAIREIPGTITLSLISSTTLFAPQVNGQVQLAHIASTSILAPQVSGRIALDLIASTQIFAPTTAGQVQLALISSTVVFAPSIPGDDVQAIVIRRPRPKPRYTTRLWVQEFTVAVPADTITLAHISSTQMFGPQVNGQVQLAHIASTSVFAPSVSGQVQLAHISSTSVFAPQLNGQIQLSLISSTVVFAPSAAGQIQLGHISSTSIFTPQLNGQVQLPLVSGTTLFAPQLNSQIQLPLISSTVVFTPAVGFTTITLELISSTSVFAPQVNGQVTLGHIAGTAIFAPQVNGQIQLSLISSTQIFAPSVPATTLSRAYVGTNAIGASALALSSGKMYVKKVSLTADTVLATIDAYLHTVDGEQVTVRPVVYTDDSGAPDLMLVGLQFTIDSVEFNGEDRWVKLPVGLHIPANGDYWIGVHSPDPGSLTIAYETTGGNDQQINSGGAWTIEPGATGGSITDPGDHLYSIRGSVVSPVTASFVGRTTVGGSNQDLDISVIYLKKVTIPAGGTLATVDAHLKVSVANVPSIAAVVMSDNSDAPDRFLHLGHGVGDGWLLENTYRWFSMPVGLQFAAETDVWIGLLVVDSGTTTLAYDTTGGADGSLASRSEAGTWSAGTQDYSIRGTILSEALSADRYGAFSFGASEQTLDSSVMYAVPVTVPAEGWAVGIEVGIRDVAGTTEWMNNIALYADDGGAPGDLLVAFGASANTSSFITAESDRWYGFPIFEWLAAGDYWIGFQNGLGQGALLYDTGTTGDGYEIDALSANVIPEPGSSGTTLNDTDRQYSLRLVVLSETVPEILLPHLGPTATVFTPQVNGQIQLAFISSTQVFAPTTAGQVQLPLIASTQLFAPVVDGQIQLGHIASTQIFSPTLNGQIQLALISSTQVFSPTTTGQIQLSLISSTQVFTPVRVAGINIGLGLISSTQVFSPTVNGQIQLAHIASTTVFSPSVTGQIQLGLISSTQIFAPSLLGQILLVNIASTQMFAPEVVLAPEDEVLLPALSTTQIFAPQVNGSVVLGHISSTQIFAPSVQGRISLSHIASTQIFGPQVNGQIQLPLISSTQVFAPSVLGRIGLALISGTTVFAPQLNSQISLPLISGTQLFAPVVGSSSIALELISGTQVFAPSLAARVSLGHIAETQVFAPSLAGRINLNHISSTQIFAPTTTRGHVHLPHIGPTTTVHSPSLRGHVHLPHVASTVVFAPEMGGVQGDFPYVISRSSRGYRTANASREYTTGNSSVEPPTQHSSKEPSIPTP